jgi:hypothetical protein
MSSFNRSPSGIGQLSNKTIGKTIGHIDSADAGSYRDNSN